MDALDWALGIVAALCVGLVVTIIVLAATGALSHHDNPCVRSYYVGKVRYHERATGFMHGSRDSVLGCLNGRVVKWEGRAW